MIKNQKMNVSDSNIIYRKQDEYKNQLKDSELQDALKKLDQINKDKLEYDKIQKMELDKIQQYNKALTFSNTYKHSDCQVSEAGKLVLIVEALVRIFVFVNKQFQKLGKYNLFSKYLMNQVVWLEQDSEIQCKKNFHGCHSVGDGTYLIITDGRCWSHHNKDVHGKQLSFTFTNNDIIRMEVSIEDKYIKWSRQNNPQLTFVLAIDTSQELYPCVGLASNAKIKILDCAII